MLKTRKEIKDYLDDCIRYWHKKRDNAEDGIDKWTAICNIDAFQSVRISIFDEQLIEESGIERDGQYFRGYEIFGEIEIISLDTLNKTTPINSKATCIGKVKK